MWIWAQGLLAVVLLVLVLPGRRAEIDEDLPEEEVAVPAEPVEGEGRRARRLRAAAQEEAVAEPGTVPGTAAGNPGEAPADASAASAADSDFKPQYGAEVPRQPAYGEWEQTAYTASGYSPDPVPDQYGNEQDRGGQYADQQQYDHGQYGDAQYGAQYSDAQYDPGQYGNGQFQDRQFQHGTYPPGPDESADPYPKTPPQDGPYARFGHSLSPQPVRPQQPAPYPNENEHRPDGSNQ